MSNKIHQRHAWAGQQAGFTLVEVGIVVPMALIVLGVIFTFLITHYLEALQQATKMSVIDDANTAVNKMNEELMVTSGFQSNLSSYLTDVYAPAGGWVASNGTASSNVVIIRALATTANSKSAAKKVVRLNRYSCSADAEPINPVLYYNIVYFLSNGTLYKRTIASNTDGSGLAACNTPFQQKQTCPVGQVNPACGGTDSIIATDVTNFTVTYSRAWESTCSSSVTTGFSMCDASSPEAATILVISLTLARSTAAEYFNYNIHTVLSPINRL